MPQRRVPSSQALLGPPAPHVDCKDGTGDEHAQRDADEEDGFRWGREDHGTWLIGQRTSLYVVMLEIYVRLPRTLRIRPGPS